MRNTTMMRHVNQHGYGVSLVQYSAGGELLNGFVLNTFPTKEERDEYANDFKRIWGLEWDEGDFPQ